MKTNTAENLKKEPQIDRVEEALKSIEADAQKAPEAFLEETRVPEGGE